MANFLRVKPLGWGLFDVLASALMNALDIDHTKAVNGDEGSHHAPTSQIWFEGEGLRIDGPVDGVWTPHATIEVHAHGFKLLGGAGLQVGDGVAASTAEVMDGSLFAVREGAGLLLEPDALASMYGASNWYGNEHTFAGGASLHFSPGSWVELFDADIELHRVSGTPKLRLLTGSRIQLDSGALINFSSGALIKGTAKVDTDTDLEIASDGVAGIARLTGKLRLDSGSIVRVQGGATLRSLWDIGGEPAGDVTIDGAWLFKDTGGANNFLTFKTGTALTVGTGATFSMQGSATFHGPTTRHGGLLLEDDGDEVAFTRWRTLRLAAADISTDGLDPTIIDGTKWDRVIIPSTLGAGRYLKLAAASGYDGLEVQFIRRWPADANILYLTSADGSGLDAKFTGAPSGFGVANLTVGHDGNKWRADSASPQITDPGFSGVLLADAGG